MISLLPTLLLLSRPALALPLVFERFDVSELPAGWKVGIAVSTGGGAASTYALEEGGLVMRTEPRAKRFTAVSRKSELRDVSWIRVQARTRTEGVAADVPATATCGVFVRFEGGPIQSTRPCANTTEWTPFTRYYAVPKGARDVEVGFLVTTAGTVRVDDLVVEPVTPDVKTLRRDHLVYHWLGSDAFTEDHLVANGELYDQLAALCGGTSAVAVEYWKYADPDTLEQYTGRRDDSQVVGDAIHTLRRKDIYGLVEILSRPWGTPPAFLVKGLAVQLAGDWDGRDIKMLVRGLVGRGEAPPLATLLDPATFGALPESTSLPLAGAFVTWVVATHGHPMVQTLFGQLKSEATVEANREAMEAALGMTLAEADSAMRGWL